MTITFLHISDLHLDTPFKSFYTHDPLWIKKIREATKLSFEKLVNRAIEEQVDFVLIVGDSFNTATPSVRSQLFLKSQLDKLAHHHIPVIMCRGNHDYDESALLIDLPKNVHMFDKDVTTCELTTKYGSDVIIYGFSYITKHIYDRRAKEYAEHNNQEVYAIGMWHGQVDGYHTNNPYAPFTLNELNSKHYDYWALGHVHKRSILQDHPPIIYSGSIQGQDKTETGKKGGVLVTLSKGSLPQLQAIDTAPIEWITFKQYVTSQSNLTTIHDQLLMKKNKYDKNKSYLVSIEWFIDEKVNSTILEGILNGEITDSLNDDMFYVYNNKSTYVKQKSTISKHWKEELMHYDVTEHDYSSVMKNFFNHSVTRTLLPQLRLDTEFKKALISESYERLKEL